MQDLTAAFPLTKTGFAAGLGIVQSHVQTLLGVLSELGAFTAASCLVSIPTLPQTTILSCP